MKNTTAAAAAAAPVADWERCKRTGTNWRCPERVVPGKTYCEKHHRYIMSRRKGTRITFSEGGTDRSGKCDSPSASAPAASVEPYRPVLDFGAAEGGGGIVEGSFVEEGELMGWFMGNDRFALTEPGVGGGFFGGFGGGGGGGDDGFALGEVGNVGGNDDHAPGEGARVEGQNGNVIVIAMEAKSDGVGKGQKRKRGRFFGS
ncbi:hypothetical protein vseg_014747 [Gypsophila vaccaria]